MFKILCVKNLVLKTFQTNRELCEKFSSKNLTHSKLEAHMRDCEAWRSLKECVVFVDIMYSMGHKKVPVFC